MAKNEIQELLDMFADKNGFGDPISAHPVTAVDRLCKEGGNIRVPEPALRGDPRGQITEFLNRLSNYRHWPL